VTEKWHDLRPVSFIQVPMTAVQLKLLSVVQAETATPIDSPAVLNQPWPEVL